MEKLTEVIEIRVTPGPIVGWLEKNVVFENDTILAEKLERKNFLVGTGPTPENTPALVVEMIEALAEINWPVNPGNPLP